MKIKRSQKFNYMMLNRLQLDCEYVLNTGITTQMWGCTIDSHIKEMRKLYKRLKIKPIWCTRKDINNYENQLKPYKKMLKEKTNVK